MSSESAFPTLHELQLLRLINSGVTSPYHLIPFQDGTLPQFYEAMLGIQKHGWANSADDAQLSLTESGKAVVQKWTSDVSDLTCQTCIGRGYALTPKQKTLLDKYSSILKDRPKSAIEYDQTPITEVDMLVRVGFMDQRGDIANKSILCMGDADLISIAIGLLGIAKEVVVIDVDARVIDFVNKVGKEHNLNIRAQRFDVRNGFPAELKDKFDVFVTDPVETLEGIKLFLSHGTVSLKGEGSVCYFGLTTLEAGTKKWHHIQRMLLDMNYSITDIRRNFNEYDNTDFNDCWPIGVKLGENKDDFRWYWTAFLRCEAIDKPVPLVDVDTPREISMEIYRDDEAWATPPPMAPGTTPGAAGP